MLSLSRHNSQSQAQHPLQKLRCQLKLHRYPLLLLLWPMLPQPLRLRPACLQRLLLWPRLSRHLQPFLPLRQRLLLWPRLRRHLQPFLPLRQRLLQLKRRPRLRLMLRQPQPKQPLRPQLSQQNPNPPRPTAATGSVASRRV